MATNGNFKLRMNRERREQNEDEHNFVHEKADMAK